MPISKVNLNAKFDYEFIKNLKILQECFLKLGIDKVVDINRLSKAKYQDNLEFTQWYVPRDPLQKLSLICLCRMKRYWDLHYPGDVSQFAPNPTLPAAAPRAASPKKPSSPRTTAPPPKRTSTGLSGAPARTAAPAPAPVPARKENTAPVPSPAPATNQMVAPVTNTANTDLAATKQREQTLLIAELRVTAEGLEKERDFYFKKLREIETLCESADEASQQFAKKIQAVLYATDDIPSTDV